jgi:hypothetical protein
MSLKVIHNLDMVTQAERDAYKREVSIFVRLDPDEDWFDYLWIPDEITGMKKLVLYARRGTTDKLRDVHKISLDDMVMLRLDSQIAVFKALGHIESGRKEAAIGAHSLEGLKDERLAAAIATAETRAGRRLTLKFVGLGILDASEVNMDFHLDNSKAAGIALAQNPMPPMFTYPTPNVTLDTVDGGRRRSAVFTPPATAKDTQEAMNRMIQAEFEAQQAKLRAEAKGQLTTVGQVHDETISVVGSNGFTAKVPATQAMVTDATPEPVKRTRKPRIPKAVNLASPGQDVPKPAPTGEGGAVGTGSIVDPPLTSPTPEPIPAAVAVLAPPVPPAVVSFPGKPTPAQEEEYRKFLRDLTFKLTNAGMMPSEGIGGATSKLRLFAQYSAGKPIPQMTTDDWDEFKDFFVGFAENNDDMNLVKYINDAIGAK